MDEKQGLLTNISGLKLENPTMLAAGILGISASSLKRVAQRARIEQKITFKN